MGFFGKKNDDAKAKSADAQTATATKEKHESDHVDKKGEKKPEVVGEVCEFC